MNNRSSRRTQFIGHKTLLRKKYKSPYNPGSLYENRRKERSFRRKLQFGQNYKLGKTNIFINFR